MQMTKRDTNTQIYTTDVDDNSDVNTIAVIPDTWHVAVDPTGDMLSGFIYHKTFKARYAIGVVPTADQGSLVYCDVHEDEPIILHDFDFTDRSDAKQEFHDLCRDAVGAIDLYMAKITDIQIDFANTTH